MDRVEDASTSVILATTSPVSGAAGEAIDPLRQLEGRVSIVLPALNEARPLADLLPRLQPLVAERGWELIVVDDGSSDGTSEVAERYGARVLRHERPRGYGGALKTGVRAARNEHVAIMDADGQHTLEPLLAVLRRADAADMVIGVRPGVSASPLWRRPGKWLLLHLAQAVARRRIPDLNSGLRVVDRAVLLRYLHLCPNTFSFTTTLTLTFFDRGRTVEYVPISVDPRRSKSTVSVATGFDTLFLILRLATLFVPLRLFATSGVALIFAGGLWAIPYALAGRGVSIGAALLVLTGVQLLFAGLLADQVATLRKERFE